MNIGLDKKQNHFTKQKKKEKETYLDETAKFGLCCEVKL